MLSLLLVEDDSQLVQCLTACLQAHGWNVDVVASAEEATGKLDGRCFDLVVTDFMLSNEQDGLFLLEYLAGLRSRPPAIFISGLDVESAAMRLGAFRFLRKPFDLRFFLDSCREAVQGCPAR